MVAFAYIVPVIACLVMYFALGHSSDWRVYAWIFGLGELTVGLLHRFFYRRFVSAKEYLGALVSSAHYEEPWVELVRRTETRTDRNGRTYTRTYVVEVPHPPKYYFYTTLGKMVPSDCRFFCYVRDLWRTKERNDVWYGLHIKGRARYGWHYNFSDLSPEEQSDLTRWIPYTESHSYKNKIRRSNSIFKYEHISHAKAAEEGLIAYPPIINHDAPCILSNDFDVSASADDWFRKFNGGLAPDVQMRLYILLFDRDRGISISERQRAYWQGGNKNEMVICIGTDRDDSIGWARCFSWADHPQLEVETARWLMNQEKLDWGALFHYLSDNLKKWKRKEFKDFDYISVSLPLKYFIGILLLSIAENIVVVGVLARLLLK